MSVRNYLYLEFISFLLPLLALLLQTLFVMVLYRGISTRIRAHTFDRAIQRNHPTFFFLAHFFDSIIFLRFFWPFSHSMFEKHFVICSLCHRNGCASLIRNSCDLYFFAFCPFSFCQLLLSCRVSFTGFFIGANFCARTLCIFAFVRLSRQQPFALEENCAIIITSDNS